MKRYSLVPTTTDADGVVRSDVSTDYVVLGFAANYGRALVKQLLPDGAAADNQTLADLETTNNASDVTASALTGAQITAIKNRLTAAGIDVSQFDADAVDDRRKLLRFLLRRWLGWPPSALANLVHIRGFDVG